MSHFHPGANLMADAIVFATHHGCRYLLLVERGDGYGWAIPGGAIEPGETATEAALRELAEETGLHLAADGARTGEQRDVPDPRNTPTAWAVTTPTVIDLGEVTSLPQVAGGDDARRAEWLRAISYDDLCKEIWDRFHSRVFAAHWEMLAELLG